MSTSTRPFTKARSMVGSTWETVLVQVLPVQSVNRMQMLASPLSLATKVLTGSSRSCLTLLRRSDCFSTAALLISFLKSSTVMVDILSSPMVFCSLFLKAIYATGEAGPEANCHYGCQRCPKSCCLQPGVNTGLSSATPWCWGRVLVDS